MTKTDIAFWNDDAHTFLPWVIGIMAAMATLMLCLGLSVGGWMADRGTSYSDSFTVNIPSSLDTKKLPQITETLQKIEGVETITQVSEEKLRSLLKPWFGDSGEMSELPLPVVFDVTMKTNVKPDYKALQSTLTTIADGIEIDTREQWMQSFSQFSAALRTLLTILTIIILGGLALIIAFMSRAALKLHVRTVQLLHSIGAEDYYITRQFQREACLLTLRGTLPGCIAAGLTYWAAGMYLLSLQSTLPPLAMTRSHLLLLLAIPLACSAIAWMTARFSVIRQLQRTL